MVDKVAFLCCVKSIKEFSVKNQYYEFAGLIRDVEKELIIDKDINYVFIYNRINKLVDKFIKVDEKASSLESYNNKIIIEKVNSLKYIIRDSLLSELLGD